MPGCLRHMTRSLPGGVSVEIEEEEGRLRVVARHDQLWCRWDTGGA